VPFVAPFKGLRYNPKKVSSLQEVVTPPYDVISPEGQTRYYKRHPWNFVRVVFGKGLPSDTRKKNRYSRARQVLAQWLDSRILVMDREPGIYPYLQEYALHGKRFRRLGVIALVRLDSPKIFPHEGTREEPKKDRLELLKAVQASLSPIFGLIPDSRGSYAAFIRRLIAREKALTAFDLDGVRHRLWKVGDPHAIGQFEALLRSRELVIADGHHRYEAACAYRQWRRTKDASYSSSAPYNYAMFYLMASSGSEEAGLLPTHRVVHRVSSAKLHGLLEDLKSKGLVRPVPNVAQLADRLEALRQKRQLAVGLYSGNGASRLLVAPPRVSHELDVEWLHQDLFPALSVNPSQVSYTQDLSLGIQQLARRAAQALFVVGRPRLGQVLQRARRGSRMPGKTTYFYPKPLAGLVEYKFERPLRESPAAALDSNASSARNEEEGAS
jgi:uncharacterized protein (DUF1015 family)